MTKLLFDAVLFDLDGVLIDSEPIWWDVIDEISRARHLLPAEGHVERRSGTRVRDTVARVVGDDDRLVESMTREVFIAGEARLGGLPLAEGAIEAIRRFSAAGMVLGLVSSSNSAFLERVLDVNAVREHFSTLVGGDRVQQGKPSPDGYLLAAREIGVRSARCCAVEDSPTGILAAAAAGMYVVRFGKATRAIDPTVARHVGATASSFAAVDEFLLGH